MRYTLGNVIILSDLMSITVRLLHVLSSLVVYITKHAYMNGVGLLQSMRP